MKYLKLYENFEENENISVTSCRHCFHNNCINQWVEKQVESIIESR
jgi:hypothetical protein